MFIELNLRKMKWLLFGTYHRPRQNDIYFFDKVGHALDIYSNLYDKFLLAGDFNCPEQQNVIADFMFQFDAKNLIKDNTCFKNVENPSCIDLFITNSPLSFQHTAAINVGCSDFHKMVITAMKTIFPKAKPKEVTYRNYAHFDNNIFRNDLVKTLKISHIDNGNYKSFETIFLTVLEKHAPLKKKFIRGNHVPYMNTTLRKAMMRRTQLHNKFYKSRNNDDLVAYKKNRKTL